MVKLQKEAAYAERKSQVRLGKWTSKEHRARLRFLKEKERYERVEGELRNAENDYEERRDHAAGLTSQVAEKTQDLDDLRGQKAADDVSVPICLLRIVLSDHSVSVKSSCSLSRTPPTASRLAIDWKSIISIYHCLYFSNSSLFFQNTVAIIKDGKFVGKHIYPLGGVKEESYRR